jgi:hypothetical protein|tara:strand:- start:1406 stop:1825 length:420 start_codon:yes stop_codon:yes gene_type:complete
MAIPTLSNLAPFNFGGTGFKTIDANSSTGKITIDLSDSENNFILNARNGNNNYLFFTGISSAEYGKSGTCFLVNGGSSTEWLSSCFYNGTTNETYTPGGSVPGIPPSGANKVSMLTYFINNSGDIYINVVNDWQAHPAP